MNGTMPWSPVSPIDSLAAVRPASVGPPSNPEPGWTRFTTISPSASATTVAHRKYPSALSASPPARAMFPSEAMPTTTVTKITAPSPS